VAVVVKHHVDPADILVLSQLEQEIGGQRNEARR
jgi:hypothetical protein